VLLRAHNTACPCKKIYERSPQVSSALVLDHQDEIQDFEAQYRSAEDADAIADREAELARMDADLRQLQALHSALLATLPPEHTTAASAPPPPESTAQFEALRRQQREWEDRMSALLDSVSELQSPGGQRVPNSAAPSSVRFTPVTGRH
jgi:hypothetical protein